ncbi:hypothetical protein OIU84_013061 [Salix udensis]|uniref:Amino acid transporter transmembrane domain-containing protein n=1 Tax=Salix udensis TaxID=889485 RepID=A0AAD6JID0_9ROSI|nr:hypothetical protein OIU84_013061 [Salix udensis]
MATMQSFFDEWSKPKYSTKGGTNGVRGTTNPPPPPMVPNPSSGPPPLLHLFDNTRVRYLSQLQSLTSCCHFIFKVSSSSRRRVCSREMDKEMQNSSLRIEHGPEGSAGGGISKNLDDDGRQKRTGTWITASAHIITAVIGSGVLSLAWAIAQLGWVVGPLVLVVFSFITFFTSTLLADSYRSPDPVTGNRNYTYMDAVRAHLGGRKVQLCGLAQYVNLIGITIGYTITASISMVAVRRSNCFHKHGHAVKCQTSNNPYMIIFACIQIMLSQIPNFHRLSWLSILAAVMSFAYASIGLGLSLAKVIGGGAHARTSLTGVTVGVDVSAEQKVWRTFQALGDIAFAFNTLSTIPDTRYCI